MTNSKKFLVSVLFVIIMSVVMLSTERKSGDDHGIIVKLELASSITEVKTLVANYDDEHIAWLRLNTQLDFLFIITYTSLFFFALKGWMESSPKFSSRNYLLLAFVPGLLDVIENLYILHFLHRDFGTATFTLYYWVVHLKWLLVAGFVVLSLIYLVRIVRGMSRPV